MDMRPLRNATIAATRWLISQQNSDGSFVPAEHGMATHCKLLLALNDMGQQPKAAQLATWLVEYALDEDGDFTGLTRPHPYDRYYTVGNAFLATGAMRLGQFSLAYPALGFITSLQHPETGGFFTAGPDATLDSEQDLYTTAVCGYACLQGGQLEAAEAAGRFISELWERQPGGGAARLFWAVRQGDRPVTDFPDEMAPSYVVDATHAGQWYHVPALAAGLLACLADATGQGDYLEGCHRYVQFLEACAEDRYTSHRSGFIGWAAALAFEMTGNANFQRVAEQAAQGLMGQQLANGSWLQGTMSVDLTSDVVDGTAEGIIILNQIMRSLIQSEE